MYAVHHHEQKKTPTTSAAFIQRKIRTSQFAQFAPAPFYVLIPLVRWSGTVASEEAGLRVGSQHVLLGTLCALIEMNALRCTRTHEDAANIGKQFVIYALLNLRSVLKSVVVSKDIFALFCSLIPKTEFTSQEKALFRRKK